MITLTKGGKPGPGLRYNVPAIGLLRGGWDDLEALGADEAAAGDGRARAAGGGGTSDGI